MSIFMEIINLFYIPKRDRFKNFKMIKTHNIRCR